METLAVFIFGGLVSSGQNKIVGRFKFGSAVQYKFNSMPNFNSFLLYVLTRGRLGPLSIHYWTCFMWDWGGANGFDVDTASFHPNYYYPFNSDWGAHTLT